ncbi:hypothetical protein [Nocardioides acrostichi]|uniref:Uncharacterized protein n=1 Tax=Nocardioides acrostichi TaxID=2784339 RepID=A0A930Y7N6_9ACTN|nr:hypothetical protein [Nocardioides acrostichi]MBF4162186.1 hypothetical protein [Nocardioides acrostichi]
MSLPTTALLASLGAALLVMLALAAVAGRLSRRLRAEAAARDAVTRALTERIDALESRLRAIGAETSTANATRQEGFVITRLGQPDDEPSETADDGGSPSLPPALFADLVLRESAVQAGTLLAGLRRGLAPESRARIRIAMRRELKRARRQRRTEERQAVREWRARERDRLDGSAA